MVKVNLSDINVPELIADIWSPLNDEQREFLANHFTLQNYKKNEVIHCEGETPTHLMCLLSGKVKIYKDGVGGRSQIIRMIKPVEYFGYRPYFAKTDYVTAASAFEPSLVCQIPMTALIIVVLPEPLAPVRPIGFPGVRVKETSCTSGRPSLERTVRCFTSSIDLPS